MHLIVNITKVTKPKNSILSVTKRWTKRDSNPVRGKRIFSSLNRPEIFWSPTSLLFYGYRRCFQGYIDRGAMFTTHLNLTPR